MNEIDSFGKYTGFLSIAETGLGSLLHAYHVPLAGHVLSLNQGFLLSRYVETTPTVSGWSPYRVSMMAAAMKSLSPMGKLLTPMLGISVQGLLFSTGVSVFGMNVLGALVGMIFLSLWAFLQPALTLFFIYGNDLIKIGQFYYQETQNLLHFDLMYLVYFLLCLVACKLVLASALVLLAFSSRKHEVEERLNKWSQIRLESAKVSANEEGDDSIRKRLRLLGKDLLQPLFLVSLLLSFAFFYLTNPFDIKLVWYLLRPIAIAALIFYARRWWRIPNFNKIFRRNNF
jgi:hypothetical protein